MKFVDCRRIHRWLALVSLLCPKCKIGKFTIHNGEMVIWLYREKRDRTGGLLRTGGLGACGKQFLLFGTVIFLCLNITTGKIMFYGNEIQLFQPLQIKYKVVFKRIHDVFVHNL